MQLLCPTCGSAFADDQAGGLCPRCLAAMAIRQTDTPVEEVPIEPGETFHGLYVEKLVARGGMGIVYRARQPVSNRAVALKILPRALAAEEEFRQRFDREARALAGLSHPGIVNLYDYGVDRDLMFLIMEFVEGVSLRQSLRDRRITPARAIRIALDVCEALQFAHREGIIHRDIKPENVLMDRSGHIKLTDFGLAKRIDVEATQLTQTHFAVGTPHYMAPEQLEQPKGVDHRVDIYSLGVLLYEMLTHELPIGRFPAPSAREGVDERLDAILYRCLEKDPARRYQTVADLKTALQGVVGAQSETARLLGETPERATPPRPKVHGNLEVRCPCGWQFYVPAAARGMVHCPACGDSLTITLPTPVTAVQPTPAPVSAAPRPAAPRTLLVLAGLLTAVVLVVLILALIPRAHRPMETSQPISYTPPVEDKPAPARPLPVPSTPEKTPVVPAAELRRQIDLHAAHSSMAGIVATVLLYSGHPAEHDQIQKTVRELDGSIKKLLVDLEAQGQLQDAPERYRPGDRLVALAGKRGDASRTLAFADELRAWLRAFQPGITEVFTVTRSRQPVTFSVTFPERSPDFVLLAEQAGLILGESSAPGVVAPPLVGKTPPVEVQPRTAVALSRTLLVDLRARSAALPAYYRTALPYEDRLRAEELLRAGTGTADDGAFLDGRYTELLRRCESEIRGLVSKIKELEGRIADPAAVTDTVVCKDGRRIEGQIIEETAETLKIKARFGSITLAREDVVRVEKGRGAAAEFRAAYEASRSKKEELAKLHAVAKERKLAVQQELAAAAIVALDPSDERWRLESGLGRSPFANAAVDAEPSPDRIEYRGRFYTPDQFRAELKSLGYVFVNGLWCEKVPRTLKVDNLYRDEARLPATFHGASVLALTQTERDSVYDYRSKTWVPRTKQVSVARYIGGGTVFIEISAPGDLVECRVRARSQVARVGGSVTVSVVLEQKDAASKLLYSLAAPGENDQSYDVTEKVAGHSRFYIRADAKNDGMFLISDSNDLGVLEVKYSYGRPVDKINALFMAKRDADASGDLKVNNDAVESACRALSASAAAQGTLTEALAEMRRVTDGLLYARDFVMPSRFSEVANQLKDPIQPDWPGISRDQALKLGSWWALLSADERREFLSSYGIWCARTRFIRGSK